MYNRLLSTAYLPPIEYFAFLIFGDVTMERCERYQKQSYRNRTTIVGGNGVMDLIIPTTHDFRLSPITEVRIDYTTQWQRIHWRSIESAYNSSPYYLYYKDALQPFYKEKTERLFDFNLSLIETILKLLKTKVSVNFSASYQPYISDNDLRLLIQPKKVHTPDYPFRLQTPYHQVFEERFGFCPNLSVLDLIFNTGPESVNYLKELFDNFKAAQQ